jgi:flagellar biosynthesis protein FlhB
MFLRRACKRSVLSRSKCSESAVHYYRNDGQNQTTTQTYASEDLTNQVVYIIIGSSVLIFLGYIGKHTIGLLRTIIESKKDKVDESKADKGNQAIINAQSIILDAKSSSFVSLGFVRFAMFFADNYDGELLLPNCRSRPNLMGGSSVRFCAA